MSHVVTIRTEVRDPNAIRLACTRLALSEPVFGPTKLFSSFKTGWAVNLPNWRYPVVCDTSAGSIDFDNFEGRWGKQEELNRFLQGYAVEKAKLEARKAGHSVAESLLEDGSVRVTVSVCGGAHS